MTFVRQTILIPFLVCALAFSTLGYSTAYAQSNQQTGTTAEEDVSNSNAFIIAMAAAGLAVLAGIIAAQAAQQAVTPSFAGRIATITPPATVCVAPPASLITLVGPRPLPLMYLTPGSFSYSYGPPITPGQSILGKAGITPVPCVTPTIPPVVVGGGFPILFHGSSLPGSL